MSLGAFFFFQRTDTESTPVIMPAREVPLVDDGSRQWDIRGEKAINVGPDGKRQFRYEPVIGGEGYWPEGWPEKKGSVNYGLVLPEDTELSSAVGEYSDRGIPHMSQR